jgi:hypothetical protein
MHLKQLFQNSRIFKDHFSAQKPIVVILSPRQVYIYGIYIKRRIFFYTQHDLFWEEKKFTPLFKPQSADQKSLDELQRARTHFQTLVVF